MTDLPQSAMIILAASLLCGAGHAQTLSFTCDTVEVVTAKTEKAAQRQIDRFELANFPEAQLCRTEGHWAQKRLIVLNIVDAKAGEKHLCFDLTATWGDIKKQITKTLRSSQSAPIAEQQQEKAAADAGCGGMQSTKAPPEEPMSMKRQWLLKQPGVTIVSETLVRRDNLYFGRLLATRDSEVPVEYCVDVTAYLSACGNPIEAERRQDEVRQTLYEDGFSLDSIILVPNN